MSIRKKISQVGLITLSILTISCVFIESGEKELLNNQNDNKEMSKTESIYNIKVNKLDGTSLDLKEFKGKKMLFVNVASKCGYTPQYAELQELYDQYSEKLEIFGVPCNQFGGQEPGSDEEIAQFCKKNYGVTFTMLEKVDVKGSSQHPLYSWLTTKEKNGVMDATVRWNFHKFLVDEEGALINMYNSRTNPVGTEMLEAINR